ncbi:hypothetical protein [Alicyclobacillus sp. SO9]|nr:hypothetical protein [Alicyclobacillus sp. SO9]QQE77978.1 hypothetical protein GI364_19020 [Alicyclobacillus sp. SO9]
MHRTGHQLFEPGSTFCVRSGDSKGADTGDEIDELFMIVLQLQTLTRL